MPISIAEKAIILFFRLTMAWTFLYAASHQVFVRDFSVVGFLGPRRPFMIFSQSSRRRRLRRSRPFSSSYGHLLIGLSLLTGLMVRVSAAFGVLLMGIYWMAHMDWPFIENTTNFVFDFHLVYAGVLVYLIVTRAGHVFGLDAWAENLDVLQTASRRCGRWLR